MAILMHDGLINCQDDGRPEVARRAGIVGWIGNTLRLWRSRIRERHSFDYADEHELHELGLSRWDVEREIRKPFWQE
jgi:uncharacterized protein YjiS (DUF1127 family)